MTAQTRFFHSARTVSGMVDGDTMKRRRQGDEVTRKQGTKKILFEQPIIVRRSLLL
jgi:hypothetical protein